MDIASQRPRIGAMAGNTPPQVEEEWPGGALTSDLSAQVSAAPPTFIYTPTQGWPKADP